MKSSASSRLATVYASIPLLVIDVLWLVRLEILSHCAGSCKRYMTSHVFAIVARATNKATTCSSESSRSATSRENPVTGYTPSEAERIDAIVQIAQRADEVGLDVFAIGEHHNPPFFSSSPTTLLAHIAALTERIVLSTAVTLITTNDPVKIAEDYAMLQHLAKGRHGPDARARQHRAGVSVVRPGHPQGPRARAGELQPAAPAVARGRRGLGGQLPHAAAGLHLDPAAAGRRAAVRLARRDPHAGDRRAGRLLRQRLLRQQHPRARTSTSSRSSTSTASASRTTATARRSRRSSASAARRSSPSARRTPSARSARTSRARRSTARATGSRTSCTARR